MEGLRNEGISELRRRSLRHNDCANFINSQFIDIALVLSASIAQALCRHPELWSAGSGSPDLSPDPPRPQPPYRQMPELAFVGAPTLDQSEVHIPMPGGGESLNVAAAASVLLYEVLRQRAVGTKSENE